MSSIFLLNQNSSVVLVAYYIFLILLAKTRSIVDGNGGKSVSTCQLCFSIFLGRQVLWNLIRADRFSKFDLVYELLFLVIELMKRGNRKLWRREKEKKGGNMVSENWVRCHLCLKKRELGSFDYQRKKKTWNMNHVIPCD